LIYIFAILCKVHFSFKKWKNQFWKPTQQIVFARERRSVLCRDVTRGHVGAPPYVSYPHRVRTPRCWSDHRSLRCDGMNSLVTFVASGPCQVAAIHRTDAPPAARHWPPGQRTSPAMPWPFHACWCHRPDLTHSQPTFPDYK
jgi:hypothetical protein